MKINHLPEIDLARYAPLSADEKRRQLRTHGLFKPTLSYRPLRRVHPDIFNLQLGDLECPPSPWGHIEKRIREECASRPDWLDANLELAELLYRHVSAKRIKSYQRAVPGFAIKRAVGHSVRYWGDYYFVEDARPVMLFLDPRRGSGLGAAGRRVAFSIQHHACATSDFENTVFKIYQFPGKGDDPRRLLEHSHDPDQIYSMDELNAMLDETCQIWLEVQVEREDETRRKTGTTGTLL